MNNNSHKNSSGYNYNSHTICSTVSLRIFGEELDLEVITNMLGRKPTKIRKKGDLTVDEKGEVTYNSVGWILESEKNDKENIGDKIRNILNSLNSDINVWKSIAGKCHVDIFCGLFLKRTNMGFMLPIDIIKMLSYRGIPVSFDIYT